MPKKAIQRDPFFFDNETSQLTLYHYFIIARHDDKYTGIWKWTWKWKKNLVYFNQSSSSFIYQITLGSLSVGFNGYITTPHSTKSRDFTLVKIKWFIMKMKHKSIATICWQCKMKQEHPFAYYHLLSYTKLW